MTLHENDPNNHHLPIERFEANKDITMLLIIVSIAMIALGISLAVPQTFVPIASGLIAAGVGTTGWAFWRRSQEE